MDLEAANRPTVQPSVRADDKARVLRASLGLARVSPQSYLLGQSANETRWRCSAPQKSKVPFPGRCDERELALTAGGAGSPNWPWDVRDL